MEKDKLATKINEDLQQTGKQILNQIAEEKLCGGIFSVVDVGGKVCLAQYLQLDKKEDRLTALAAMFDIVAKSDKTVMKAMVIAAFRAEIAYTKDVAKRKIIGDKWLELAELFDE